METFLKAVGEYIEYKIYKKKEKERLHQVRIIEKEKRRNEKLEKFNKIIIILEENTFEQDKRLKNIDNKIYSIEKRL